METSNLALTTTYQEAVASTDTEWEIQFIVGGFAEAVYSDAEPAATLKGFLFPNIDGLSSSVWGTGRVWVRLKAGNYVGDAIINK